MALSQLPRSFRRATVHFTAWGEKPPCALAGAPGLPGLGLGSALESADEVEEPVASIEVWDALLVGALEHYFFLYIWNNHHWLSYFSEGWKPVTSLDMWIVKLSWWWSSRAQPPTNFALIWIWDSVPRCIQWLIIMISLFEMAIWVLNSQFSDPFDWRLCSASLSYYWSRNIRFNWLFYLEITNSYPSFFLFPWI